MTFRARLKAAAEDAVIAGVKCAIVLLVVVVAFGWLLNDYRLVRQAAFNGQQVYNALRAQQQAAARAQPADAK